MDVAELVESDSYQTWEETPERFEYGESTARKWLELGHRRELDEGPLTQLTLPEMWRVSTPVSSASTPRVAAFYLTHCKVAH